MYEWRSHTAEIELAIEAETDVQVFEDALAAFAELAAPTPGGEAARYPVTLAADDRAALLVDWLEELIFLADSESFVAERADELQVAERSLTATLAGRRTSFEPLVKAATYHGLHFACDGGVWHARLVLDV